MLIKYQIMKWDEIMKCWVKLFFRIVRAQASDVAVYTCVASNRAGVDNKHFSLQVLGMLPATSLVLYYVPSIKQ